MLIGDLALAVAALFTGAAFYINFAEQPARLLLDDQPLLVEWKPAYKRGYAMQGSLALIGFILGILAWWQTGTGSFLIGGLLMLANWPWTLIVMMPTNNTLMGTDVAEAGVETQDLIVKWGKLHAVRTGFGAAAMLCFLLALSSS